MKSVCIFISSTFKDFHSERDILRMMCLPLLKKRLADYNINVEISDLRWGLDIQEDSDAAVIDEQVLQLCFDEIGRCQPYILVFLGDQYGWVPSETTLKSLGEPYAEYSGKSATEMEIIFGIIKKRNAHAFFFFRDSLPKETMTRQSREAFFESDANSQSKLEKLKDAIRRDPAYQSNIFSYSAEWDAHKQSVAGLEPLVDRVVSCLVEDVRKTFGDMDESVFLHDRIQYSLELKAAEMNVYQDYADEIITSIQQGRETKKLLSSPQGTGKSTILAYVHQQLALDDTIVRLAYLPALSETASMQEALLLWNADLQAACGILPDPAMEPPRQFAAYCDALRQQGKKVVCFLDDVHLLSDADNATLGCVTDCADHVILAQELSYLSERKSIRTVQYATIPELNWGSAKKLIEENVRRQKKFLNKETISRLLRHPEEEAFASPLYWVVAIQYLLSLGEMDFKTFFAKRKKEKNVVKNQEKLIYQEIEKMPAAVLALTRYFFRKILARFGEGLTAALELLCLCNRGLRLDDLLSLEAGQLTPLEFTAFVHQLKPFFEHSTMTGIWFIPDERLKTDWLESMPKRRVLSLRTRLLHYVESLPAEDIVFQAEYGMQSLCLGKCDAHNGAWDEEKNQTAINTGKSFVKLLARKKEEQEAVKALRSAFQNISTPDELQWCFVVLRELVLSESMTKSMAAALEGLLYAFFYATKRVFLEQMDACDQLVRAGFLQVQSLTGKDCSAILTEVEIRAQLRRGQPFDSEVHRLRRVVDEYLSLPLFEKEEKAFEMVRKLVIRLPEFRPFFRSIPLDRWNEFRQAGGQDASINLSQSDWRMAIIVMINALGSFIMERAAVQEKEEALDWMKTAESFAASSFCAERCDDIQYHRALLFLDNAYALEALGDREAALEKCECALQGLKKEAEKNDEEVQCDLNRVYERMGSLCMGTGRQDGVEHFEAARVGWSALYLQTADHRYREGEFHCLSMLFLSAWHAYDVAVLPKYHEKLSAFQEDSHWTSEFMRLYSLGTIALYHALFLLISISDTVDVRMHPQKEEILREVKKAESYCKQAAGLKHVPEGKRRDIELTMHYVDQTKRLFQEE